MPRNPNNPNERYALANCKSWKAIKKEILKGCQEEGWVQADILSHLFLRAGIGRTVYYRWMEEEQEFADTISTGKVLAEKWWIDYAKKQMNKRNWQNASFRMIMQNSFKWNTEKIDVESRIHAVKNEVDNQSEDEKMGYIQALLNSEE